MFENENLSEKNQAVAEPEKISNSEPGGNKVEVADPSKQSNEDNARFAAARRAAEGERDALINRMNNLASKRGFKSFDELEKAIDDEERNSVVTKFEEETGLSAEAFKPLLNDALRNNPDIIEAKRIAEQNRIAESRKIFESQMAEIKKLDGSINSIEDIKAMPQFNEFDNLVRRGYSLTDAYKLVNFDKLSSAKNESIRQATVNNIESKSHLAGNKGGAGSGVVVPRDVADMYREFNPGITDEEIYKDYSAALERDGN